jgi:MFS superfamily sulfate permease-like transporter
MIFNGESYVYHRWHTALLMWIFTLVPLVFNIWFKKLVNIMETIGIIIHVVAFIVSIITLASLAERSTNDFVWNTIVNDISGWTNKGAAFGIGLLTMVNSLIGKIYVAMS